MIKNSGEVMNIFEIGDKRSGSDLKLNDGGRMAGRIIAVHH